MSLPDNPTVLALDAAGAACSAALWRDGNLSGHCFAEMARGHAEALMGMVEAALDGDGLDTVDAIAVTTGPGTYTGLRIAIAAARGLALAAELPCLGVTSTEVIAASARDAGVEGPLAVVLETKREDFYLETFPGSDGPQALCGPDALARIIALGEGRPELAVTLAGDAASRLLEGVQRDGATRLRLCSVILADAAVAAKLAARRIVADPSVLAAGPPRPLYLRPPDATPPGADRHRLRS